jgi:hypothetical protein
VPAIKTEADSRGFPLEASVTLPVMVAGKAANRLRKSRVVSVSIFLMITAFSFSSGKYSTNNWFLKKYFEINLDGSYCHR